MLPGAIADLNKNGRAKSIAEIHLVKYNPLLKERNGKRCKKNINKAQHSDELKSDNLQFSPAL